MTDTLILRQRKWTDDELKAGGFRYFQPIKRLIMARLLAENKRIDIETETITGKIGDFICYRPGTEARDNADDYDHWPVRRDIFFKNYKAWDDPDWQPNPAERHLLSTGCQPFYKALGVWAQRLHHPQRVQSLESPIPAVISPGYWLIIGVEGEPYSMSDESFRGRYAVPQQTLKERMYWAALVSSSKQT